ncbi:MAG: RluA family pseudouridine synthase [Lachnospiraceae bacterium]|nr:RluA family pseudouridine synthase [Lachnospiraceae bacterium]
MIQIMVTKNEAGQRLDKLLARYMRSAPKSFFYKMLRKKNITLNGKKAAGNEIVEDGDSLKLFLSDETYEKLGGIPFDRMPGRFPALPLSADENNGSFPQSGRMRSEYDINTDIKTSSKTGSETGSNSGSKSDPETGPSCDAAENRQCQAHPGGVPILVSGVQPPDILYQDSHVLLFNKPAGMLSQKASPEDVSLVEYLNAYLSSSGCMSAEQMQLVRPAICNRLDRNTSGIVVAGISLAGLQTINRLLKDRSIRKYYRCIVCGEMHGGGRLYGYLKKDARTNTVQVVNKSPQGVRDSVEEEGKPIETSYQVLASAEGLSLLEVHLITGRSHQIRAHLASIGHPILGDPKYGDRAKNCEYRRRYGVTSQLLHAYRLEFPDIDGELSYLSEKKFCAPLPEAFSRLPVSAQGII